MKHRLTTTLTIKGHVICKNCKTVSKLTSCQTCKQIFVDAPNVVLDKLISMIALPCRFRSSGCGQFVFPDKKIEHETFCSCRPINCQYAVDGCSAELPYKDLAAHHRQCQHNPRNQKWLSLIFGVFIFIMLSRCFTISMLANCGKTMYF